MESTKFQNLCYMYTVLSISFKVDIPTEKVSGSLLLERQRRKLPNLDSRKCYFHRFPDSVWALRTIKIKYVYCNRAFPQKSQSLAFLKKVRGVWGHTASENFEI